MEKKQGPGQLELFSGSVNLPEAGKAHYTAWQSRINLNIEQTIMFSVIVLMLIVFSFSLGVEKGKVLSGVSGNKNLQVSETPQTTKAVVKETKQEVLKQQELAPVKEAVTADVRQKPLEAGKYTIQVASFKKRSSVDEEAKSLKGRGYEAVILPKGNYIILCVGKFGNREEAKGVLGKLKNKYKDCLIREL